MRGISVHKHRRQYIISNYAASVLSFPEDMSFYRTTEKCFIFFIQLGKKTKMTLIPIRYRQNSIPVALTEYGHHHILPK